MRRRDKYIDCSKEENEKHIKMYPYEHLVYKIATRIELPDNTD